MVRAMATLLCLLLLAPMATAASLEVPAPSGPAPSGTAQHVFAQYLRADYPVADGFDFPVGNKNGGGSYVDAATKKRHRGWRVSVGFAQEYSLGLHPGEDWNGRGGGSTDLGQPVFAIATGRVVTAKNAGQPWGNIVVLEHQFYQNHKKVQVHSVYAHLQKVRVQAGQTVDRRQPIGTLGQDPDKKVAPHLHFEIRQDLTLEPDYWPSAQGKEADWIRQHYHGPTEFIGQHRRLFVPQREANLLLLDQATYKMCHYQSNHLVGEYQIALGQGHGAKQKRGDLKTPKGMYFVVAKSRGPFAGKYGAFYGGHWIKINYPNQYDAQAGLDSGVIGPNLATKISSAWRNRQLTPQKSPLGSSIGIHGWASQWDWSLDRHLSWGCIVMHNGDVKKLYPQLPKGTMVVIF